MHDHRLYKKVCNLLNDYNVIQARIRNIDLDLARMPKEDTPEEAIEGMYYSRVQDGGPPASGGVSDRTSTVAQKWIEEFIEVNSALHKHRRTLEVERKQLSSIISKIDNAMGCLESMQREIVEMFYFKKMSWPKITIELHKKYGVYYSERHCKRIRTEAVVYMVKAIFGVKVRETA
ncbi:hypothetical protein [Desulforamulus aquiferis]|uniref:Uncharacterized protein n=1 Tax=Desulforamulus aquiferis TaxID=1397668 RepID=A0AAW7ZDL5_9FIRM|nr:hypothetical protein [Desulforamulus aquiferis]MDO7787146.1 hypothetical protein [Desulforamulus aquiferis]